MSTTATTTQKPYYGRRQKTQPPPTDEQKVGAAPDQQSRRRDTDEERQGRERKMRPGGTDRLDGGVLRTNASPRQRIAFEKDDPDFLQRKLEEKQRPDFIETTLPEDPSDHFGQLTRDNVNPDIPSAPKPGKGAKGESGGIVDPNSLGMDQSQQGAQPPPVEDQREQWPQAQKMPASGEYQKADDLQQQHAFDPNAPMPEPLRTASINEPPGSNIYPGADTGPNVLPGDGSALPPGTELPPLVLTDIDPDSAQVDAMTDTTLTVTGSGFGPNCVILFDDEELPTTFVNQTTLTASVPTQAEAGVVDVEVARGEDLSDVLTFEFVAPAGRRSSQKATRKPKKTELRNRAKKKSKEGKR